jgi:hypothetical protein
MGTYSAALRTKLWRVVAVAIAPAIVCGCGGERVDDDSSSGVDSSRRVTELSDEEIADLCDWSSAELGGYGVERECSGQTVRTQASQQECMNSLGSDPSCTATVGDIEKCINALDGDLCRLLSEPACLPLFQCAS